MFQLKLLESIWAINEDREKNRWIGTDEGLYKISDFAFKNINVLFDLFRIH